MGVDQKVSVNFFRPDIEETLIRIEIARGNRGDEVLDLFGMKGAIHNRKAAAHTYPHQVDFGKAVPITNEINDVIEITVNVFIYPLVAVLARGLAPVDHVQVDSLFEQILD